MYSKTLLLHIIVNFVLLYGQRNVTFFRNDYKYIEKTKAFYKIHTAMKIWMDAKKTCAQEGASLFYPENANEVKEVVSFWNQTQSFGEVFVGISDLIVEGIFDTIDGKLVSEVYNMWWSQEPNNSHGDENCVVMSKSGLYNDVICSHKWPFICKKSLQSLEWNYDCKIPYLGYVLNEELGSCYQFHMTPLTWKEAYAVCRHEQSQLAVISSTTEHEHLMSLAQIDLQQTPGPNDTKQVHIGFHNLLNEGWQTVKGTQLHGYNFTSHTIESNSAQCGSMSGRNLTPINCEFKRYFICEHELHKSDPILKLFSNA